VWTILPSIRQATHRRAFQARQLLPDFELPLDYNIAPSTFSIASGLPVAWAFAKAPPGVRLKSLYQRLRCVPLKAPPANELSILTCQADPTVTSFASCEVAVEKCVKVFNGVAL
jgi:hypothetical protein